MAAPGSGLLFPGPSLHARGVSLDPLCRIRGPRFLIGPHHRQAVGMHGSCMERQLSTRTPGTPCDDMRSSASGRRLVTAVYHDNYPRCRGGCTGAQPSGPGTPTPASQAPLAPTVDIHSFVHRTPPSAGHRAPAETRSGRGGPVPVPTGPTSRRGRQRANGQTGISEGGGSEGQAVQDGRLRVWVGPRTRVLVKGPRAGAGTNPDSRQGKAASGDR